MLLCVGRLRTEPTRKRREVAREVKDNGGVSAGEGGGGGGKSRVSLLLLQTDPLDARAAVAVPVPPPGGLPTNSWPSQLSCPPAANQGCQRPLPLRRPSARERGRGASERGTLRRPGGAEGGCSGRCGWRGGEGGGWGGGRGGGGGPPARGGASARTRASALMPPATGATPPPPPACLVLQPWSWTELRAPPPPALNEGKKSPRRGHPSSIPPSRPSPKKNRLRPGLDPRWPPRQSPLTAPPAAAEAAGAAREAAARDAARLGHAPGRWGAFRGTPVGDRGRRCSAGRGVRGRRLAGALPPARQQCSKQGAGTP